MLTLPLLYLKNVLWCSLQFFFSVLQCKTPYGILLLKVMASFKPLEPMLTLPLLYLNLETYFGALLDSFFLFCNKKNSLEGLLHLWTDVMMVAE